MCQEEFAMQGIKVLSKGRLTLPKVIREKLHIQVGDILLVDVKGEQAVLRKGKTIFDFIGVLPSKGMTINEIRDKVITTDLTYDEVDFKRISGLTVRKP